MSRFSTAVLLTALTALAGPSARAQEFLLNGSFESPVVSTDSYCFSFTDPLCAPIPGWTGDLYLINGAPGPITPPAPLPDGSQFALIQATSAMEQSVTIDAPGVYQLTWSSAGRAGYIGASGNESYQVTFDGVLQGLLAENTGSPWHSRKITIVANQTGTFPLRIEGTTSFAQGDNSVLLDDFRMSYFLPEPDRLGADGAAAMALVAVRFGAARRRSRQR